ncbi:MAG: phenylalanine--tRNA ligase subunit beta [Candidatus Aenigmarchaeota archaeon]|nr:phenylalanine--tRNA ligase subunit beta [Candidatus Aenigmarchaeota archaeon]
MIDIAVAEFIKKDLEKIIGRKLSEDDYKNKITMLGCPLEKMDSEKVSYEISPNRPDMYSAEGFARAIKNFLGLSKSIPSYNTKKSGIKLAAGIVTARPYITAAVVRNVKFTEEVIISLIQLQEKLHETIGRKRKKVAIGIHDLDKVKPPFCYKAVKPEEISFVPLDAKQKMNLSEIGKRHPKGKDYMHTLEGYEKWPIIVDKNNDVLSFPPIINGELTRLTEKTRNLFIDVTGTSDIAINHAINILVAALSDRGFSIETVEIKGSRKPDLSNRKISINIDYANKLLDLDLTKSEMKTLLSKMCLGFDGSVIIPPYRTDIMHPIDIVEDLAIAKGYGTFEAKIPRVPTIAKRDGLVEFLEFLRGAVIGLGFQETVGAILTNKDDEFRKMNIPVEEACETTNPVTVECTMCRKKLLPSLLKTFSQNKHMDYPQCVFELGDAIVIDKTKETNTATVRMLACGISNSSVSYEQISSYLDAFLKNLGINYKLKKFTHSTFIEGRCAEIIADKQIGIIGEVHPQVLENWKLEKPVAAFELNVEEIFKLMK